MPKDIQFICLTDEKNFPDSKVKEISKELEVYQGDIKKWRENYEKSLEEVPPKK